MVTLHLTVLTMQIDICKKLKWKILTLISNKIPVFVIPSGEPPSCSYVGCNKRPNENTLIPGFNVKYFSIAMPSLSCPC